MGNDRSADAVEHAGAYSNVERDRELRSTMTLNLMITCTIISDQKSIFWFLIDFVRY
jgi:hypothetical protein